MKRQRLKSAVEAAQAYMKIQPPHQTIGDAVLAALTRQNTQLNVDKGIFNKLVIKEGNQVLRIHISH